MSLPREKLSLIHVAKKQTGMADEDYRALLRRAAGVTSSMLLDDAGFNAVLAEFERLGFRSTSGRAQRERREGMATQAQIGKIRSLYRSYKGADDERALNRWLERHFHVSHVRFLQRWPASKAVAILTGMQKHPNAKRPARSALRDTQLAASNGVDDEEKTHPKAGI